MLIKKIIKKTGNLDRDGRDVGMVIGNDNIISQNDNVVVDFLGHALSTGCR